MATPNLGISHIAASQNQKEVTANAAFDDLDTALTDYQAIAIAAADVTPSATVVLEMFLDLTGTQTLNLSLILPSVKRLYVIRHSASGGNWVTIKTAAGGSPRTVLIEKGDLVVVYCDGTNFDKVSVAGKPAQATTVDVTLTGLHGEQLVTCDATAAAYTITLPDATKANGATKEFVKTDAGGNVPTLAGNGSQNINGANTYAGLTAQYKYVRLKSDGVQWWITSSN